VRFRPAALGVSAATVWVTLVLAAAASAHHSAVEQITVGPAGGNGPHGPTLGHVTPDGTRVLFNTAESLVSADTDTGSDVYERANGLTRLITPGPIVSTGAIPHAGLVAASEDGLRAVIRTRETLTPDDTDNIGMDLYEIVGGTVTLLSTGPVAPTEATVVTFVGASPDATRVYFQSYDRLVPEDNDGGLLDIYERTGGVTTLASTSDTPGTISADVITSIVARDGSAVYFTTTERLAPEDTDSSGDLYEHSAGVTRLISQGTINGNGQSSVGIAAGIGFSYRPDPDHVFFDTTEALVPEDTDVCNPDYPPEPGCTDLYERTGGVTRLVSGNEGGTPGNFYVQGPWFAASEDGTHAVFQTAEQLVSADVDFQLDVYERFAGETRLVSTGPVGGNGPHDADTDFSITPDGSRIFFETPEKLTLDDVFDGCFIPCWDMYERSGGGTTLITKSPEETPSPNGLSNPLGVKVASDGALFFITNQNLLSADTNDIIDTYERRAGELSLIPPTRAGTQSVVLSEITPDGAKVFITTPAQLGSFDTDNQWDFYVVTVQSSAYARPKAATPIELHFVPAYEACGSPNRVHAEPLSYGSCAPPAEVSDYLTQGTPDANGQPAKAVSKLRLLVLPGNPSTPANEADARYEVSITDVRNKADLTDYTGALKLDAALQITDRNNPDPGGGSPNATGSQPSFPVIVPCASTADTTVGSTCSITTTAATIAPGSTVEGKRAVWETSQVRVTDGGADGNPATTDGEGVFLVQGVFIP
jgi:hypothetical protein